MRLPRAAAFVLGFAAALASGPLSAGPTVVLDSNGSLDLGGYFKLRLDPMGNLLVIQNGQANKATAINGKTYVYRYLERAEDGNFKVYGQDQGQAPVLLWQTQVQPAPGPGSQLVITGRWEAWKLSVRKTNPAPLVDTPIYSGPSANPGPEPGTSAGPALMLAPMPVPMSAPLPGFEPPKPSSPKAGPKLPEPGLPSGPSPAIPSGIPRMP